MKVLHLPTNISSLPSHTIRGLRKIGVGARGFVVDNAVINSADGLKVIDIDVSIWRKPHLWFGRRIMKHSTFLKLLIWADVIHWYPSLYVLPFYLDLELVKFLNKPAVVEWLGGDIRIPDIEFLDNPYYKQAFENGYEYSYESRQHSIRNQKRYTQAGFLSIVAPCVMQYFQKKICPIYKQCKARLFLEDFIPEYPEPNKTVPLIIHSPNKPVAKGTSYVLNAINKLKLKYNFEFILNQEVYHKRALERVRKADIFLDQFVIGHYGMASIEAMAYGKPVVCYIKSSTRNLYPAELPIVNANPDNLFEVLESLLQDGKRRHEIGKRSREYVEKYHDAIKLAHQLKQIYHEAIRLRRRCKV